MLEATAFASPSVRRAAARPVRVKTAWSSREELEAFDAPGGEWVLVEEIGGGGVAVGPVFGARRGCVGCYLRRRASNGGRACRPAREAAEPARRALRAELSALFGGERSRLDLAQVEIFADGRTRRHRFFPMPDCVRCWRTRWEPAPLSDVIDPRLGLIRSVSWERVGTELGVAVALGASVVTPGGARARNDGEAADVSPERARARAIGESLERYASAFGHPGEVLAPRASLGESALEPRRLDPAYGAAAGVLPWLPAERLVDGSRAWVPAHSAYLPLPGEAGPGEPWLGAQTSNGLAAGPSRGAAILHALSEVVEREALLHALRAGGEATRLDVPSAHGDVALLRLPCARRSAVVVALLQGEEAVAAGAGAGASVAAAGRRALLEALASPAARRERAGGARSIARLDAWTELATSAARSLPDEERGTEAELLQSCPDACVVDLTTPDLALAGVHVVRCLLPGAPPLDAAGRALLEDLPALLAHSRNASNQDRRKP